MGVLQHVLAQIVLWVRAKMAGRGASIARSISAELSYMIRTLYNTM